MTTHLRLLLAIVLLVAACGTGDTGATATDTSSNGTVEQGIGDGPDVQFTWADPDPFDATFGAGSRVVNLAGRMPSDDMLPASWESFDPFEPSEADSCTGREPLASLQTGWVELPGEEFAGYPNLIMVNFEDHGTPQGAQAAASFLGSEGWDECQRSMMNQPTSDGVQLSSDDPAGIDLASVVERDGVRARRQQLVATAFGNEFDLQGDTHVWVDGSVLTAVVIVSDEEASDDLAVTISAALPDTDVHATSPTGQVTDDAVSTLRRGIERDPDVLRFFSTQERALFELPVEGDEDCDTNTEHDHLVMMNGPVWISRNGSSAVIQGGFAFEEAAEARAEVDRFERIGVDCMADISAQMAGDVAIDGSSTTRIMVDGVEVLLVHVDFTQLASNFGVPGDIQAVAQRAMAQVGTNVIGYGFVGVAGDEPDLVALTASAAQRMVEG